MMLKKGSTSILSAAAITIPSIVNMLRRNLDSPDNPIVDKTGFTANFDVADLEFADLNAGPDTDAPSLVTALQEKLGLKLTPTKGPVEVVVIDSIDKPSET